ncbi:MAG: hypothetical protein EXR67_00900 [Dehalococcoidia bacterium]|nr:hypothetical protein [Dehalococcoidia bacterium]
MKSASRGASRSRHTAAKPRITSEVREIHTSLTRLETKLTEQRSEFTRLRRLDSKANIDTIIGSTVVGIGLFFVSGVPLPSSASPKLELASQLVGLALGAFGLLILIRAYREWRAFLAGAHHKKHHPTLVAIAAVVAIVLLGVTFYAGAKVASSLGAHFPGL